MSTTKGSIKKHVCVIGSGTSGIVVMKELLLLGHTVTCFEKLPTIGGVYVRSYENTKLTTSSLLTSWSDYSDGQESNPKFWTAEEYLEYINNYTKKYNLLQYIKFCHNVLHIQKCKISNKWLVTVQSGIGFIKSNPIQRCNSIEPDLNIIPFTLEFDSIAVCTGTNNFSSLSYFPGQEKFKGEIIHSENYYSASKFNNKRVLIIGAGESGSDIANEISYIASKTAIYIRGKHGHIIPRIQSTGRVTDLNTNRCRYSNPYIFGNTIGYVNQLAKRFFSSFSFSPNSDMNKVIRKIGELNMIQNTSAFSKFGCKNEGFVSAIVLRNAELYRDSFEIHENKVVFSDGREFECDVIIACTGYKNCFPYFDKFHPKISYAGMNPRLNYKQVICIDYPKEIGFFGFARPAFGSIPPITEMQARLWAYIINGDIELPSNEIMKNVALNDKLNWERRFSYDSKRVNNIVDFQIYCDSIAEIIGCLPPLFNLFFTKPKVWLHIMFGPFTMNQYRLVGPYSNRNFSEEILLKQPLGDILESSITISFLLLSKILSIIGFNKFKPNNF
jgi:dimethylaniline monooxygenase (N-oxide forming)